MNSHHYKKLGNTPLNMLWCKMFNLYAEVDSNMPIPQMIRTSTSWLNTTNPEIISHHSHTKAWTWFNSCCVNFNTFYLSWCPKGKRRSLFSREVYKFTETHKGKGYTWHQSQLRACTSQKWSQCLVWKMVSSSFSSSTGTTERPKWGQPAGPLSNSDKKGNGLAKVG